MRVPFLPLIITVTVCLLIDWQLYRIVKTRLSERAGKGHLLFSTIVWMLLIVAISLPRRSGSDTMLLAAMWMLFAFATVNIPKALFIIIDSLSLLPKMWHGRRWKHLTHIGAGLSVILFSGFWWGALVNRFNINVNEVKIAIPDLPEAFDGYTIVQFSDIHTGTFGTDTTFVSRLVTRINDLQPDAIVFTGDIVNRYTKEIEPHISPLSKLHARDGVYSILGNHDYGDYSKWDSPADKRQNLNRLIDVQSEMGWHLLLDDHTYIHAGNDSIAIVGVENIGDPPFPSYGSLSKALKGINPATVKILLSHNPAHWNDEIITVPADSMPIALTLSGHTHAMQIELLGISPAAMRYPQWGGLYSDDNSSRQLYVNIGAGTVGMPMRLGATPEITLITLHRAK